MSISARPARDEADYEHLHGLLRATWGLTWPPINGNPGNLDWWRFSSWQSLSAAMLWEERDGTLCGVAWPNPGEVELFVDPRQRGLEDVMLDWAEAHQRAHPPPAGRPHGLRLLAFDLDQDRGQRLRRRGYRPTDEGYWWRTRSLTSPVLVPELPAGYTCRPVRLPDELAARAGLHALAFEPSDYDEETHRAVAAAPAYRPDLDLVVVAPDGALAACCLVWLDPVNQVAAVEPIATHPAHRRRGLARALLLAGAERVRQLGARLATVVNYLGDEPAARLYDSAGFCPVDRHRLWELPL